VFIVILSAYDPNEEARASSWSPCSPLTARAHPLNKGKGWQVANARVPPLLIIVLHPLVYNPDQLRGIVAVLSASKAPQSPSKALGQFINPTRCGSLGVRQA